MISGTDDLFPSLSSVLRDALGERLASDATRLLDMMADDIVFEFPYAPPGGVKRLGGKAALAAYLPGVASLITIDTLTVTALHPCCDPEVVVIEFAATGRGTATGAPYDQLYISVVRVRGGRIVHYRDYWNPLVVMAATSGVEALTSGLVPAACGSLRRCGCAQDG